MRTTELLNKNHPDAIQFMSEVKSPLIDPFSWVKRLDFGSHFPVQFFLDEDFQLPVTSYISFSISRLIRWRFHRQAKTPRRGGLMRPKSPRTNRCSATETFRRAKWGSLRWDAIISSRGNHVGKNQVIFLLYGVSLKCGN